MQKVLLLLLLLAGWHLSSFTGTPGKEQVVWMLFEEAEQKLKEQQRPVLVDVYTDWCGWCKVMDKKTYARPQVIRYLNENFYNIRFDAESKEPVTWKGKTYKYDHTRRIHELALELITGEMAFPNTVIIPPAGGKSQSIPGFLAPRDMELVARYYGDGVYRKRSFDNWARTFRPSWK